MLTEITIIIILCTFQSLFGVGLLLFGTPTFLLLGYSFVETLIFLLPISIIISFLQIIYNNNLNKKNSKEFIIYCIPFLVFFLILSNINNLIDIKIIVSSLLIISSIISLNFTKVYKFKFFVKKYAFLLLELFMDFQIWEEVFYQSFPLQ